MARTKIAPALEHLVSLGSEVYAGMEWMPEARRELRSLLRVYRIAEEAYCEGHEKLDRALEAARRSPRPGESR